MRSSSVTIASSPTEDRVARAVSRWITSTVRISYPPAWRSRVRGDGDLLSAQEEVPVSVDKQA